MRDSALIVEHGKTSTVEIVIPVYNEERALPGCIEVLHAYLQQNFPFEWSITIADNASTDKTPIIAQGLAGRFDRVQVLRLESKGRGLALRTAWSASDADIVAYMDVDLSTGLDALLPLIFSLVGGHSDVAIGSRLAPGARTLRSPKRELISRCYNMIVRLLHGACFSDAQCGFKAVRTEVIKPLLAHIKDDSWFFDTELLLLAEHNGLRVHEVPVDWVEDTDSRVHVVKTVVDDLCGLMRVLRAKSSGKAAIPNVSRRPALCSTHPAAVVAQESSRVLWQLLPFGVIGALSTAATLILYLAFRTWWPPLAANLVAQVLTTFFNTESNRRWTFFGSRGSSGRIHLQGLLVFIFYYAFTSGALLFLNTMVVTPSRTLELAVLFVATGFGTLARFILLRAWVFSSSSSALFEKERGLVKVWVRRHWQQGTLAAICLLAAVLYGWNLWSGSWGNTFYTAAVKSMSHNFTNFLFGSFDPAGVVTVDKPPMALWAQVISVWIFGFHSWSVLLPQVVEGVATVFLLHRTVRRWAGENTALLAALILAVTPVTVAINHVNDMDSMLVLWLMAAAYALTRAVVDGATPASRTRWVLGAAFLIGCGFVTKMLAAWIVVPAMVLAFWIGSPAPFRRRVVDLLGAAVMLLASSFWWPLLHDLWPWNKPYIDNSTNGTALNLIFGYNGFGRIMGEQFGRGDPGAGAAHGGFPAMLGGGAGIGRMFSDAVGGQISWLIPLSLLLLIVVLVTAVLRPNVASTRTQQAGWIMWGMWLVVGGLVFSYARGIFHPYYTTLLAPPIAAISAAGLALLCRFYRRSEGMAWLLLPLGVAVTAGWAYVLVSRDQTWNGWAGPSVLLVAVLAILALFGAKLFSTRLLRRTGLALTGMALLLVPTVWSTATAFAGTRMGSAGPPTTFGYRARNGGGVDWSSRDTFSTSQRRILDYAIANSPTAQIKLAVEGGSMQAAPFIINSDATVIGLGGFMGNDNVPTVAQLAGWVSTGKLKFVLGSSNGSGRRWGGASGRSGTATKARDQWIRQNCTVVDPAEYLSSAQPRIGNHQPGNSEVLYQCTTKQAIP